MNTTPSICPSRCISLVLNKPFKNLVDAAASILNRHGRRLDRRKPGPWAMVRAGLKPPGAAPAIPQSSLNSPALAWAIGQVGC